MPRALCLLFCLTLLCSCVTYERRTARVPDSGGTPRKGQKPYTVNGERYEPLSSHEGFVQSGIASWYGSDFHGRPTSSGERYDMYAMTAAHKTLPLGVHVRVRNRDNGRETVVRINDRGPFVAGRIIDLSQAAARELNIVTSGTAPVRIEALGYLETGAGGRTYRPPASYDRGAFGIQVGAFTRQENARRLADSVRQHYCEASIREAYVGGTLFYRVRAGNFSSLRAAEQARDKSADPLFTSGYVVALD